MIERKGLRVRRGSPALGVCCWLMACGSVEHEAEGRGPTAIAGSSMVDTSGDAAGQSPEAMGNAAGKGGTSNAPAGSMPAGTGGDGGNPGAPIPNRWPLIEGDPGCPPFAPNLLTCGEEEITCAYPGLDTAEYGPVGEVRCACVDQQWWCLSMESSVPTQCPPGPGNEAPCSSETDPSVSCNYKVPGQAWSAQCWCKLPFPEEQGMGGAAPEWVCGL